MSGIYVSFTDDLLANSAIARFGNVIVVLVDNYTPNFNVYTTYLDIFFEGVEISGEGYSSGESADSKKLTNRFITAYPDRGYFNADDVVWNDSTITASGAILFYDVGNPFTAIALGYIDFGGQKSSSNGIFEIKWDDLGIFLLVPNFDTFLVDKYVIEPQVSVFTYFLYSIINKMGFPGRIFSDVVPVQEQPPFARYSLVFTRNVHTKRGNEAIERNYRVWFYAKEGDPVSESNPSNSAVFYLEKLTGGYLNSILDFSAYTTDRREIRLTGKESGYEEESELHYIQLDFKELEIL